MKQAQLDAPITKFLKEIEAELIQISSGLVDVMQVLQSQSNALIEQWLQETPVEHRQAEIKEIQGVLQSKVYDPLREAKYTADRFARTTQNAQDLSKKTEIWERFKDEVKDLVYESDWYKKRFPADYERRRRKREMQRYRQIKPYPEERRELIRPEERVLRTQPFAAQLKERLSKVGQLENIQGYLQELIDQTMELYRGYFTADSPIVKASDKTSKTFRYLEKVPAFILGTIFSKIPILSNIAEAFGKMLGGAGTKDKRKLIQEQRRMLENVFGFEGQPGKYITMGGDGYVMPIITHTQEAMRGLQELAQATQGEYDVLDELQQATAKLNRLKTRLGFKKRRQLRAYLLERLASNQEVFHG